MSEWKPVRSFAIDNGELDGLSPQECFVLGYELARIDAAIDSGDALEMPVHADNANRIESYCREKGREYRLSFMHNDISESWMQLSMEAKQ